MSTPTLFTKQAIQVFYAPDLIQLRTRMNTYMREQMNLDYSNVTYHIANLQIFPPFPGCELYQMFVVFDVV